MSGGPSNERVVATLVQVPPAAGLDDCPHRGAPLNPGELSDGVVMCPFHAWEFDVRTGECVSLPEARPLRRLAVRVEDGVVKVAVGSP